MTQEQKDAFKKKLLEEKAQLQARLSEIGTKDKATGDWEAQPEESLDTSDENEMADRFEDYEERTATMNALEPHLAEVESALMKIEANDNSYGVCDICGNDIESERMQANPAASTCMAHLE